MTAWNRSWNKPRKNEAEFKMKCANTLERRQNAKNLKKHEAVLEDGFIDYYSVVCTGDK